MKRFFYLFLLIPFLTFTTSCSSDDDDEEVENIGTVTGTWGFESTTASVESDGSLSTIANPLLAVALQTYAGSQEPSYYIFKDDNTFETYVSATEGTELSGSGTYSLSDNTLTLTYSETSSVVTFDVITANETTLKIRKDYSSSYLYWGADLLGQYTGLTITKANATMTYGKS